MPQQTAIINGVNYSWANISVLILGNTLLAFTKIKYSRKQKKENNFGAGSIPISRGYGNIEPEGSIEMFQDTWRQIVRAAPKNDPFLIPMFNIVVLFGQINGIGADKDTLLACEFTEDGFDANQGDTKLLISVPLIIGGIQHG